MDFNTGSEAEESSRSPGSGRADGGSGGGGYDLSDPVQSFIATARAVLLQPVDFFRGVTLRDSPINPIVFAVICATIGAVLTAIISVLAAIFGLGQQGVGGAIGGLVGAVIITPILTPVGLFIGAGISHLFVMLFVRPANSGFWATFRVVSYASATSLISWIPIIGGLVAAVWLIVLSIFGIREMHSTTTGRAALVVLVPVAIVILLLSIVAASVLVAIFAGGR